MRGFPRVLRAFAAGVTLAVVTAGCSASVTDLPLPGGTDTGDDPIEVKAEFVDVLDLVPQSTVKVNDVSVGKITEVELEGETAVVTMELPNDIELPKNTIAEIRQTSLLGEKFVSLSPPETGASSEQLGNGDVIPLEVTSRNPEVEEVLGALSLLLNGGGIAQLKTIAHELNLALEGREESAKSVFRQIEQLMGQLDENKADIVAAIEGLNRLSVSVSDQMETIDAALEELPSALRTIDQQRGDLVRMLEALNELSDVGVRVIRQSKTATIQSFQRLVPVLTKFAESGDAFANAFHVFLTYPFVDEVVGRDPQVARNLHMGDYTNLSVTLDVHVAEGPELPELPTESLPSLPTDLPTILDPVRNVRLVTRCLRSNDLGSRPCRKVLRRPRQLARLEEECEKPKNEDKDVCRELNALPEVGGDGDGGPVDDLTSGLPRPGFGAAAPDWGPRGPTMGDLMKAYDPDLVSLLVPGMVVTR